SQESLSSAEGWMRGSSPRTTERDAIPLETRMKVHVIGGGPAGLYFAILMKKAWPQTRITVFERNRPNDTFGFGVVFSDQTRDTHRDVAADGITSSVRQLIADDFKPSIDLRPNFFSWMGSTRPFDAFTFFFRETEHGIFIAHCYQYEPQRSTWIIETDPQTFARAGLDKLDEATSARFIENLFKDELNGHQLITNRSVWRNFPTIRCERSVADNLVLIG